MKKLEENKTKVIGMIPARYASSRFPGKSLAPILNKSLIQHTFENARSCDLFDELIIATDDQRIFQHVSDFGANAVMTSAECLTGTDRLIEAAQKQHHLNSHDIIVNIQGDEPCVSPETIKKVVKAILADPSAVMSTAAMNLQEDEASNRSIVKCVLDLKQNALYFSRSLLPAGHQNQWHPKHIYYKHIGIYAYRYDFLLTLGKLKATPLQLAEDLEQLKILEHGYQIKVAIVEHSGFDVNVPEDILKLEKWLCNKKNISSSQVASALL